VVLDSETSFATSTEPLPQPLSYAGSAQVVLGENRQVGTISGTDLNFDIVTYNAALGNANVVRVAVGDTYDSETTPDTADGNPAFNLAQPFTDLAVSGGSASPSRSLLTFVGSNDAASAFGVIQYDNAGATRQWVFYENAVPTAAINPLSLNQGGTISSITHQVNAVGTTLVGGEADVTVDAGDEQVLYSAYKSSPATLRVQSDAGVTDFNEPAFIGYRPKRAITSQGNAVFVGTDDASSERWIFDSSNLASPRIEPGDLNSGFAPSNVIAATPTRTLFLASDGTTEVLLSSANPLAPLASYDDAGSPTRAVGQMSQVGNIAAYVPDATGSSYERVIYSNGGAPVTLAATDGSGLLLAGAISTSGVTVPSINNSGVVVFDATVAGVEGYWYWLPGMVAPLPIVQVGDDLVLTLSDGPFMVDVQGIFYSGFDTNGDILKDGLSEDNNFAFGIVYQLLEGDFGTGSAVLLTSIPIPEPVGAVSLLVLGCMGVAARRRR